jgi:hypothetical protein
LLELAFQAGRTLAEGKLRLAEPVAASGISYVALNQVMKSARPSRIAVAQDKLPPTGRNGRSGALYSR